MTVALTRRADITLDAVHRVAWQGEGVRITEAALARIAECRAAFLRLIDTDPDLVIYGVTTAMGELADRRLRPEERDRHARIKAFAAATAFGDKLPERVVRGIVLARLANFLEGHAATTPRIALAVAAMLDGGPLPSVPAGGQGGAGEILALYPLFAALSARFDLEVKERGSLINGSPCAARAAGRFGAGGAQPDPAGGKRFRPVDRGLPGAAGALRRSVGHVVGRRARRRGAAQPARPPAWRRRWTARLPSPGQLPHRAAAAGPGASGAGGGRARRSSVAGRSLGQPGLHPARRGGTGPSGWPLPQHRRLPQRHGGARRWTTWRRSGRISACCATATARSSWPAGCRICPTC